MWIKDRQSGRVFKYGESQHDSLVISEDGRYLTYENLQNGDGSLFGAYVFTDENGNIPNDIEAIEYGRDYADIGLKMLNPTKVGEWIYKCLDFEVDSLYQCSACEHYHWSKSNYCPNCGAEMSHNCNT